MSTHTALLDYAAIHSAFRAGAAAEDSLDAQLNESLAALEAYQSHLDGWQAQLAGEREQLRREREQLDRDRESVGKNQAQPTTEMAAELDSLREKSSSFDAQRAELASELEATRARESKLKSELEAAERTLEQERAEWAQVSQQLREGLELRGEAAATAANGEAPAANSTSESRPTGTIHREPSGSSAVLGSIVEQFGKLRQQRAIDRQGSKKAR